MQSWNMERKNNPGNRRRRFDPEVRSAASWPDTTSGIWSFLTSTKTMRTQIQKSGMGVPRSQFDSTDWFCAGWAEAGINFSKYRPDIVFHAAAHKHVPLMEDSPNEAIKNNVIGTLKTARTASHYQVKKFILISTDKAVNPTNIMGASKRLCEMVIQLIGRHSTTEFAAVRWKCTGKQRKCHSAVPPSDRTRRSGDGYA